MSVSSGRSPSSGSAAVRAAEGGTRLLVTFERAADAPPPEFLMVSWVGQGKVIADQRRVPGAGNLPAGVALGTFEIEVSQPDSWRTLVAQGMARQAVVAEGAVRVLAKKGVVTAATVRLLAGRMPDMDGDGIPDTVDNCPLEANRGQGPCQRLPDGGLLPDAGPLPDGSRADAAGDAGRADGAADSSRADAASDVRPPDATPDARPPDAAPKLPAGARCQQDDQCQSGHCVGGAGGKFCASANMVAVPAGPFTRGCNQGDPGCQRDERPQRVLMLKGFEIDRTEVIQSEYQRCVAAGRCTAPAGFNPAARGNYPVTNLSWSAARRTAGGPASGCPPRPSGRRPRVAPTTRAPTPGATTSPTACAPSSATVASPMRCRWRRSPA
jgi:hypothetical protein